MPKDNKDDYQTLEWIVGQSEEGLFLAVAKEAKQKEMMAYFAGKQVGIYDCKQHSENYMFRDLKEWGDSLEEMKTLLIFNFQYAMQHDQDYKRLNFSRDMLAGMRKNLIFFTTAEGDDGLALKAHDFYSFLKIRILFGNDEEERTDVDWDIKERHLDIQCIITVDFGSLCADLETGEPKLIIESTECLVKRAQKARKRLLYYYAELCLLAAQKYRKKVLGPEHLEMAGIYHMLGGIYEDIGKYDKAEEWYKRALHIRENALDREHPDALETRKCIMRIYENQGAYEKLREFAR